MTPCNAWFIGIPQSGFVVLSSVRSHTFEGELAIEDISNVFIFYGILLLDSASDLVFSDCEMWRKMISSESSSKARLASGTFPVLGPCILTTLSLGV